VYLFPLGGYQKLVQDIETEPPTPLILNVHYFEREYGEFCWGTPTPLQQTITSYSDFEKVKEDCDLSFDYSPGFFSNNYLFFYVRASMLGYEKHTYYYSTSKNNVIYYEKEIDPDWDETETIIEFVEIPKQYILPESLDVEYIPISSN